MTEGHGSRLATNVIFVGDGDGTAIDQLERAEFVALDAATCVYNSVEERLLRGEPRHPGGPYDFAIKARRTPGGLVCTELTVGSAPDGEPVQITAEGLRRVSLPTLLRAMEGGFLNIFNYRLDDQGRVVVSHATTRAGGNENRRRYRRAVKRAGEKYRRRVPDDDLRRVADAYRRAIASGFHPTAAVEEELRLRSRAQAGRWVMKARNAGHLGPAPSRRRPGEVLAAEQRDQTS
jgi:hypothetical protein